MHPGPGTAIYRFDRFCLDLARETLRGPGDTERPLRPKVFALLALLVQNPRRLLRREELLEALWPNVTVTDDSLTQCVSDLRRALGARARQVLLTQPRRGYVLAAEVRRVGAAAPELPAQAPPAPAPAGDVAARRRDTVMVPPFDCTDGSADAVRLARAFAADLVAELIRFDDLRVVAIADGAAASGYRLRGEVHAAGAQLHLTIRLEDAAGGGAFWAERLDRPLGGLGAMPAASVIRLAAGIELQVSRESLRRARQKPPAALSARELCLLGRDLHQRGTEADTRAAREMFVRAIAADPDYAAAHAWQSFTVMRCVTHGWGPLDWKAERDRALSLARRAMDIEPDSPLCLSALAFSLALCERWDDAIVMARIALRTGRPADYGTRISCGEVLAAAGQPEEAADAVRQALLLDPHCPPRARAVLGRALLLAGHPADALCELRWCAARLPDYAPCFRSIVVAAMEAGRVGEARAALREMARLQPNWVPGDRPVFWFLRHPEHAERFEAAVRAAALAAAIPDADVPC